MEKFYIKELDAKKDSKLLLEIVKHEDIVFGEASVGTWNIKPFTKYGKVFAMINLNNDNVEKIVSVIEILRSFDTKTAYIYGVSAAPEFENQGHTSKLFEFVMNYIKKFDIEVAELTVDINNVIAQKIYIKNKFEIVEMLENEYGDNVKRYLMRYNKNKQ